MIDISRRQAVALFGAAATVVAFGGMAGCSSSGEESDPHASTGFSDDTQVKDYDLTCYIMADENLKRHPTSTDGLGRLEQYFSKYQEQAGRGGVSFAVKYMSSVDMATGVTNGFSESFDGLVGLADTIGLGVENGVLYGGRGGLSVRELGGSLDEQLVIVKASGSSVEMPKAKTLSGEDALDGSITKLQSLSDFDGNIAVAATSMIEGVMANKMLYQNGYYTSDTGMSGEYSDQIKSKIRVYQSISALCSAVKSGDCGMGMIAKSSTWNEQTGIEIIYEPGKTMASYKGASVTDASEGGVARDFFEYLSRQV